MAKLNDVCDYIIIRMSDAGGDFSFLKLQKLIYYVQAWNLAFTGKPLFEGKFQAWVHGPVSREIYDRFKDTKMLFSPVARSDISADFSLSSLSDKEKALIDSVLEAYGKFSGAELEAMSHKEDPWLHARTGYRDTQRCEVNLDEALMQKYYAERLISRAN